MNCACGRRHYCPDSSSIWVGDYDHDGNLVEGSGDCEEYLENALEDLAADPAGVVIHYDTEYVETNDLDGHAYVLECPCNGLTRYEDFIWDNKDCIRKYLKTRIDQEYVWAEEQKTLNKLSGIP